MKNILILAEEFSISKPSEIIEEVQEVISQWPKIAKECGVSSESLNRIQKKFEQIRD